MFPPNIGGTPHDWIYAKKMGLYGSLGEEWSQYIKGLHMGSFFINDDVDELKWTFNINTGLMTTSLAHQLITEETIFTPNWWHSYIWS